MTITPITGTKMTVTINIRSGKPSTKARRIKIAAGTAKITSIQIRFLTIRLFMNSLPDFCSTLLTSSLRRGAG